MKNDDFKYDKDFWTISIQFTDFYWRKKSVKSKNRFEIDLIFSDFFLFL